MLKKKLLLVGWDAADWQIINPLLKQGKLPALARLMAKGGSGNIASLDPPISPMLWTSIATGKRPYKHGIHGFTEVSQASGKAQPVRGSSRTCKAIWNILNEHDLKTHVIGWWPSHPAEPVNGIMVSNFFGVLKEDHSSANEMIPGTIFPERLANEMAELQVHPGELTAEIIRPFFPDAEVLVSNEDEMLRSVMKILAHASSIHAAATFALENEDWDFGAVYYDALDHFSHIGMKFHPPQLKGVNNEDFKKYHYIVEGAYRFHDMMLDRLLDIAGEECNVMLVSDHGFVNDQKRLLKLPEQPGAPALEHRHYGILIASGPDFKQEPIYGASLLDVTPTLLNFYGLPHAKDFDGRILNVFNEIETQITIDSYEGSKTSTYSQEARLSTAVDQEIIKQLHDLGYIEMPVEGKEGTILVENQFYLSKSLADGGLLNGAIQTIEPIAKAYPSVARYTQLYSSLLLRIGKADRLEKFLEDKPDSIFNTYMKGLLLLYRQKPLLALETFSSIQVSKSPQLSIQIAISLMKAGMLDNAKATIIQVLNEDPDNIHALNVAGEIAYLKGDWERALHFFLKSSGLIYYQPRIHEKIGLCLIELQHYSEAAQAMELAIEFNPQKASIKQVLIELYKNHVSNESRLKELIRTEGIKPAIIVTGFPRSGTSMMMQLLEAGGMEMYSDGLREADKYNPKGYYELDAVKRLTTDDSFMQEAPGKVIKIVMPLIRFYEPNISLKVIWMDRAVSSILKSQEVMAGRVDTVLDFKMLAKLEEEQHLMDEWLNRYPWIEYIKLNYEDILDNSAVMIEKISTFVEEPIDKEMATAAIHSDMRHH